MLIQEEQTKTNNTMICLDFDSQKIKLIIPSCVNCTSWLESCLGLATFIAGKKNSYLATH